MRVSAIRVVQFFLGTASFMFLARIMARFGEAALAGHTTSIRLVTFVLLPVWGVGNAAATLVGQNLGAGHPDRAERSVWITSFVNMCILAAVAVVFIGGWIWMGHANRANKQKRRQSNQRPTSANRENQPFRLPDFPEAGELKGKCYVIDGDTIVIKRTKIRLAGVDAPELDQPWGQKAKWAMVELCKGQVVTAKLNGERSLRSKRSITTIW